MIIEAIVRLLVGLVRAVGNAMGVITMPSWWSNVEGWLASLASTASGFGSWIPWTILLGGVGFVMSCMVLSFTIRIVRIVVSVFTGGGGSAA